MLISREPNFPKHPPSLRNFQEPLAICEIASGAASVIPHHIPVPSQYCRLIVLSVDELCGAGRGEGPLVSTGLASPAGGVTSLGNFLFRVSAAWERKSYTFNKNPGGLLFSYVSAIAIALRQSQDVTALSDNKKNVAILRFQIDSRYISGIVSWVKNSLYLCRESNALRTHFCTGKAMLECVGRNTPVE